MRLMGCTHAPTHLFLVVADLDLWVVLEGAAGLHHELVDAPVLEVLLQHQGAAAHRQVEHVRPVDVCRNKQSSSIYTFLDDTKIYDILI